MIHCWSSGLFDRVATAGGRSTATPRALTGDANFAPLHYLPAYQKILLDIRFPESPFGG